MKSAKFQLITTVLTCLFLAVSMCHLFVADAQEGEGDPELIRLMNNLAAWQETYEQAEARLSELISMGRLGYTITGGINGVYTGFQVGIQYSWHKPQNIPTTTLGGGILGA